MHSVYDVYARATSCLLRAVIFVATVQYPLCLQSLNIVEKAAKRAQKRARGQKVAA